MAEHYENCPFYKLQPQISVTAPQTNKNRALILLRNDHGMTKYIITSPNSSKVPPLCPKHLLILHKRQNSNFPNHIKQSNPHRRHPQFFPQPATNLVTSAQRTLTKGTILFAIEFEVLRFQQLVPGCIQVCCQLGVCGFRWIAFDARGFEGLQMLVGRGIA